MSSFDKALKASGALTRQELESRFCKRLTDDALRISVGSEFDALQLWKQRNAYLMHLAKHGLTYDVVGTVI